MKTTEEIAIIVTDSMREWLTEHKGCPRTWTDDTLWAKAAAEALIDGSMTSELYLQFLTEENPMTTSPSPEKVFGRGSAPRVKDPSEMYDETRYDAKHCKTGEPVFDPFYQRECATMSEASKARAGVLFKHLANKSGLFNNPLDDHENALLSEVCEKQAWCGKIGSDYFDEITPHKNIKALIDDVGSGGLEVVPIEFDADIVSFPLLTGELFPLIDSKPVPRGRRIEGASINTPTMAWNMADGTAITLYNTAAMVAAINTSIWDIAGAIEIGNDFLSDSPVAIGATLTALIGERLMNELDNVIANGNGTNRPEGIFTAAGVGVVATANGNPGPPTVADYINLLFGIGKQYRNKANRVVVVSNDTTYSRSRQIAIDTAAPTTDQRPALSPLTTINDYSVLGWPHKIENNIANTNAAICAMARYRMYRRAGLEIRFERGGDYLSRNNLSLLVYRARFGGRLMDANAACRWTNGQT